MLRAINWRWCLLLISFQAAPAYHRRLVKSLSDRDSGEEWWESRRVLGKIVDC